MRRLEPQRGQALPAALRHSPRLLVQQFFRLRVDALLQIIHQRIPGDFAVAVRRLAVQSFEHVEEEDAVALLRVGPFIWVVSNEYCPAEQEKTTAVLAGRRSLNSSPWMPLTPFFGSLRQASTSRRLAPCGQPLRKSVRLTSVSASDLSQPRGEKGVLFALRVAFCMPCPDIATSITSPTDRFISSPARALDSALGRRLIDQRHDLEARLPQLGSERLHVAGRVMERGHARAVVVVHAHQQRMPWRGPAQHRDGDDQGEGGERQTHGRLRRGASHPYIAVCRCNRTKKNKNYLELQRLRWE